VEIWEVWYPNAASDGLLVARGKCDTTEVLWLHAAPETLRVEVRDFDGQRLAFSDQLQKQADGPMTRLVRKNDQIMREDRWPTAADIGALVLLPGGEIGQLVAWWNASDGTEWRWSVEFYNHR
jgi:hypothetical protein